MEDKIQQYILRGLSDRLFRRSVCSEEQLQDFQMDTSSCLGSQRTPAKRQVDNFSPNFILSLFIIKDANKNLAKW